MRTEKFRGAVAAILALALTALPGLFQPMSADAQGNPLIEEMLILDEVFRDVVSGVALGSGETVHKALHAMHGTMEKTHEGVHAGAVKLPKNADRMEEFVAMDKKFHQDLENLAHAVGSRDEGEEDNGISHFIEHMTFKGTRTRNSLQIAKELDAIGGFSNAFTGAESTCFHSRVLNKHLETLADILSDIFLNSLFDPQDMSRERQVILQEINMLEDTPDEQVHVLFNGFFWLYHPLGMPIMGTPATVASMNKQTVLGHSRRFYPPGRIIVAAAGNVDHDGLVRYLAPLFESLPAATEAPVRTAPSGHFGVSCHPKDLEQVHLCLGGNGPHLSSELRFAGAVLNAILGT